MKSPEIIIYTDGAARGNPGPGGYGAVLMHKSQRKELSQGYRLTTNNRMELLAVIVALETLKIKNSAVTVYTDSKYVSDAVEKKWVFKWEAKNFKNKKNPDLWKRFLAIYPKHQVKFIWIKGHANIPENERCDELAVKASENSILLVDEAYESEINNNHGNLF
jgi:ribonuclease HI